MKNRASRYALSAIALLFFISLGLSLHSEAAEPVSALNPASEKSGRDEHPKNRNTLRAHLMALGTWMASTTNYWLQGTKWEEDIDFKLTVSDQMERLFSIKSYRFDSNTFATNWQHAISGAGFYNIYRTNGFSRFGSLKYSFYTSLLWEYISEYQEVVSINDILYNTLGALTIGENVFQMGSYLFDQDQLLLKSLGCLLNPVNAINRLLDGKDRLDLRRDSPAQEHLGSLRFTLSGGDLLPEAERQSFVGGRLDMELLPDSPRSDPEYRPLSWQSTYLSGRFSLSLCGSGPAGINEYRLTMKNMLFGWLFHDKTRERERVVFALGMGNGFELYRKKAIYPFDTNAAALVWDPDRVIDEPTSYSDKCSSLSILGPSILWMRQNRRWFLKVEGGLHLNFALMNSLPLNLLSQEKTISDTKVTWLYYGYYYALGFDGFLNGHLEWSPFIVTLDLEYQRYRSIDGLDRFQEKLAWDPRLEDSRTFLEAGLFIRLLKTVRIGCVYEQINRWGRIDDFRSTTREERFSLMLGLNF